MNTAVAGLQLMTVLSVCLQFIVPGMSRYTTATTTAERPYLALVYDAVDLITLYTLLLLLKSLSLTVTGSCAIRFFIDSTELNQG